MRGALALLALLLAAFPAGAGTIMHGGTERSYETVVPDGLALPAPTLFALHGGGGGIARMRNFSGLDREAARIGMVVVFPQGIGGHWNDGRDAPTVRLEQDGRNTDDTGFLVALATHLAATGIADPRRTYVTGISNGGMMSLRLACEAAGTFAAFAPVTASLPVELTGCRPARPVPVLLMNGTLDRLILWQGGPVAGDFPGDRGRTIAVEDTVAHLADANGCVAAPETLPASDVGNGIRLAATRRAGCRNGVEVTLYRFDGMGHRWPDTRTARMGRAIDLLGPAPATFDAAAALRDFLLRFRLD
ncbi:MAG: prolyl oligopeptidase family serine peptidase [Pseudomonadota bacterium]|nr:prolyl oligopeptidase family serine peptidase [Pseudomonadota bacterium]